MCAALAREVERWDKYRHNRSSITRQPQWESAHRTHATGLLAEALRPERSGRSIGTTGRLQVRPRAATVARVAVRRSRWPRLCRIPRPRRSARCLRTTPTIPRAQTPSRLRRDSWVCNSLGAIKIAKPKDLAGASFLGNVLVMGSIPVDCTSATDDAAISYTLAARP